MLKILDKDKAPVKGLRVYSDLCIESVLDLDDKTLSFSAPLRNVRGIIVPECYIETKEDRFVVKEVTRSTDGTVKVTATLDMEDLEGKSFRSFQSTEQTIQAALQLAFAGTGWTIGECTVTKKRTLSMTNVSALDILSQALKTYRAEIKVDSKNKQIRIYEAVGEDKGVYFTSQLNLKKLSVQSTSYDFYTELEPYGKDGMTIASVNNGKTYVENHQYSSKVKRYIWKDERYTVPESLKEDAEAKLADMSRPYSSYSADVIDLSRASGGKYAILSYSMGDTVTLMDGITDTREKQRIVGMKRYPDNPGKDTCTLANKVLTFDELAQKYEDTAGTVDNITNDNGQIDGDTIDGIYSSQIYDLENAIISSTTIVDLKAQYLQVSGKLTAVEADIGELDANVANIDQALIGKLDAETAEITYAKIKDLEAATAQIGTIEADYVEIRQQLNAASANIEDLFADFATLNTAVVGKLDASVAAITYATITELNAAKADIGALEADSANIKSLLAGNAGVGDLQNIHLTSANAVIDSALIRDAVMQTVTVGDLLAGTISTNKFVIASDDGGIRISGATQQWKDENGVVRVQIGKDAQGDFTFSLFDATGTGVLIDSTGIKAGAIADGLIVNDMVADDAAIAGSKLDIESVFEEMNGSTAVLKSNRIWFDDQNQSLTQVYSQMSNSITTVGQAAQNAQAAADNAAAAAQGAQSAANEAGNAASQAVGIAQDALDTLNGISTLDGVSAILSNDAHVVHTNTDGSGGDYSDCWTKIMVYSGDTDVSDQAVYMVEPSAGVTGTWNAQTRTYQVTGMTVDDGYVDIDALYGTEDMPLVDQDGNRLTTREGDSLVVRSGGTHIRKRFSISKSPDGKTGISYKLRCSTLVIRKQQDGSLQPDQVTFYAQYNDGTLITDYSGRYKIEESTDGTAYEQKYLSAADEPRKNYTPSSSDVKAIRCTLYSAGGIAELDSQSVIILTDADGLADEIDEVREGMQTIQTSVTNIQTGMEGIQANISDMTTEITGLTDNTLLYNVQYSDNGDGTVTLIAKVYKNGQDVTSSFSSRWFTWYSKSESGGKYIGYGYSITVNKNSVGFGSTYIGRFTTYETRYLTTRSGAYLTTRGGNKLTTWVED